jgi:hypothetical protein
MLGLGLNIAKPYMIHELDMLTIPDLLMWYERGAAVLFRQAFVQEWPNHPELNSAYDLVQTNVNNMPNVFTNGDDNYTFTGTSELVSATQKDFFEFTIVVTLNLNESVNLTNEGLLGRKLNDLIKLYRGGSPTRVGYKLEGTNYDGNNMDIQYPLGDFVMSFIRYHDGLSLIRINGEIIEDIQTDILDALRFNQVGSGTLSGVGLDSVVYEIAIFENSLTDYDLENVEDYLLSRI